MRDYPISHFDSKRKVKEQLVDRKYTGINEHERLSNNTFRLKT